MLIVAVYVLPIKNAVRLNIFFKKINLASVKRRPAKTGPVVVVTPFPNSNPRYERSKKIQKKTSFEPFYLPIPNEIRAQKKIKNYNNNALEESVLCQSRMKSACFPEPPGGCPEPPGASRRQPGASRSLPEAARSLPEAARSLPEAA